MDKKLLDALAAKAEQRKADKTKAKQFEVGGQMLDFVKIGHTAQLDAYEAFLAAREQPSQMLDVGAQLIYDCCPALQDTELHTVRRDLGADGCPRGQYAGGIPVCVARSDSR